MLIKNQFILFFSGVCFALCGYSQEELKLWYKKPASSWNEALPVGNGRLGAMVFGQPFNERIQLNEESMWSGEPKDWDNPEALKYLPIIRKYLSDGNYVEAQKLVYEKFCCNGEEPGYTISSNNPYGCYQTLGDLILNFADNKDYKNYYRSLNLCNACSYVKYFSKGANFEREIFSSATHQVVVVRLKSDLAGTLNFSAKLSRPECFEVIPDGLDLVMQGQLYEGRGICYAARMRIIADGDMEYNADKNGLVVSNSSSVTILISAATNFKDLNYKDTVKANIDKATSLDYQELKAAHVEDYQKLFNRVELNLGKSSESLRALPTDERLKLTSKKVDDPELINLYFQFGRYLLISSSRPGTLPANLQGIWAEQIQTPWNCDFHANINLQMNYWPAEITNLSECHLPLIEFIKSLQKPGAKTAQSYYGANGWVTHWITNLWGFTSPGKDPRWGFLPSASGWLCKHLWDHYCFTGDEEFLKEVYPVMKSAAEFYCDFLVEEQKNGWLVTSPSSSPENAFCYKGQMVSICMGPSMDQQIVYDLFSNTISASEKLGVDKEFAQALIDKRSRLAPPQISKKGRLQEWLEAFSEIEAGHRHISHLFAVYPGEQISIHKTPELAEAAKKTLHNRLSCGGGHTGWSQAWIISLWAHLGEPELSYVSLKKLLKKSTLPNLFDSHPPFQIDGNFGGTTGIVEMLLQSYQDEIHILPALPSAWPTGSFKGLCAKGAVEIDCIWENYKIKQINLKPKKSFVCKIKVPQDNQFLMIKESSISCQQDGNYLTINASEGKELQLFT